MDTTTRTTIRQSLIAAHHAYVYGGDSVPRPLADAIADMHAAGILPGRLYQTRPRGWSWATAHKIAVRLAARTAPSEVTNA